jgi:hypothetical protein
MFSGFLGAAPASASTAPARVGCHIQLTATDNGRRVHACPGAHVEVLLWTNPASDPSTWWSPVTVAGGALAVDLHHPHVLPARGVTLGFFVAVHRGSATLGSTRPVCASTPGGPICNAMQAWRVTVSVR